MPYVSNKRHVAKVNEFVSSVELWTAHIQDCSDKFSAELTNFPGHQELKKEMTELFSALRRDSLLVKSKAKKMRTSLR